MDDDVVELATLLCGSGRLGQEERSLAPAPRTKATASRKASDKEHRSTLLISTKDAD